MALYRSKLVFKSLAFATITPVWVLIIELNNSSLDTISSLLALAAGLSSKNSSIMSLYFLAFLSYSEIKSASAITADYSYLIIFIVLGRRAIYKVFLTRLFANSPMSSLSRIVLINKSILFS